MEEGVPPKEDLDFFKELNNYYSPFAHLVSRARNFKKNNFESQPGIDINFDEKFGSFGRVNSKYNPFNAKNNSKAKLIKKNSSRNFKMKLANESYNSNISNGDIKINFRPSENNLSVHTNIIIDCVYESLVVFEEQVRDLFRSEKRRQTFINERDNTEKLKSEKRKTLVLRNVHHFNPK